MARFKLYIWNAEREKVAVTAKKATKQELKSTAAEPQWQTDWTSDYITDSGFDVYALKTKADELVALGAYEVREENLGVYIVYMEGQAESNPTLCETPK